MTLRSLASALAKKEGKKSQARIGDIRELISLLVELEVEHVLSNNKGDGPVDTICKAADRKLVKHLRPL